MSPTNTNAIYPHRPPSPWSASLAAPSRGPVRPAAKGGEGATRARAEEEDKNENTMCHKKQLHKGELVEQTLEKNFTMKGGRPTRKEICLRECHLAVRYAPSVATGSPQKQSLQLIDAKKP